MNSNLPIRLGQYFAILLWAVVSILGQESMGETDDRPAQDAASLDNQIARLIKQLDDSCYEARETASKKLEAIGSPAIRPLAVKAINGSPESVWRIKQVLEAIGIQGDEETFYKSVSLLQLLSLDSGQALDGKFVQLKRQWKREQKKNTIEKLRELGATIVDPFEDHPELGVDLDEIRNKIFINDGIFFGDDARQLFAASGSAAAEFSSLSPTKRRMPGDRNPSEMTKQIDEVLVASLEDNREKVFGDNSDPTSNLDSEYSETDPDQIEQQLRMAAINRQNNFNIAVDPGRGITVVFDEKWSGTVADLQRLQTLPELTQIEFANFNPGRQQLAELVQLGTLSAVKITGDEIPAADLKQLNEVVKLRELEFVNRSVDADALQNISRSSTLANIIFTNCNIQPDALDKLRRGRSLRTIFFNEMEIDSAIFLPLSRLPNLNYVSFSICKIDPTAYQQFDASRPNLTKRFTPQAFLGVRGPSELNNLNDCEISQVVPGSGAEKGGMQVGDVVEKIDGHPIEHFDQLRLHIAQHKPGEILTIVVRRDGKFVELKIELSPFDSQMQ